MKSAENRLQNLDATRFWAFLAVFLLHVLAVPQFALHPGIKSFFSSHIGVLQLGVDYFFVLSGFIISYNILTEQKNRGQFSLTKFYTKRALRIWPLYLLMIIIIYSVHYYAGRIDDLPQAWHFLFTLNFYVADNGIAFLPFAAIFWTIAVELQFYAFAGIVFKFFRKNINDICVAAIMLSVFFRLMTNNNQQLFFNTFSYVANFAAGILAAQWIVNHAKPVKIISGLSFGSILIVYLLFFINLLFYSFWYNKGTMLVLEKIIFSSFFVFLILEQLVAEKSLLKLGRNKTINYLGEISFGLYCFHTLALTLFYKIAAQFELTGVVEMLLINPLFIFGITVILAWMSHTFIEKRFLLLSSKPNG